MHTPHSLPRRLWAGICRDWREFLTVFSPPRLPEPGLYHYSGGDGRRIHLRIEPGGGAVLFLDVTETIHLNATAALLTKLALDGVPATTARTVLYRRFRQTTRRGLHEATAAAYTLVERLRTADGECPLTAVPEVARAPLFSIPVSAPYKADLALTYRCNNACAHCYNEPGQKTMPSLSVAEWQTALERLAAVGVPHVLFTGGEPTLFPELPALIRHADRLDQVAGVITNGRRLADRDYLQELIAAGLDHAQITLESCRPDVHQAMTGAESFAETVQGIDNAVGSGIHVLTNTTLTRQSAPHALETIDFLHAHGVRAFAMNGMIRAGKGREAADALEVAELAPLLAQVRDRATALGMRFLWYTPTEYCRLSPLALGLGIRRCNAAEYSLCIEPNGDVLPCQSYYEPAGNILRDPWERIWNSALFLRLRERVQNPEGAGLPDRCRQCPDLSLCGGGCPLEREAPAS